MFLVKYAIYTIVLFKFSFALNHLDHEQFLLDFFHGRNLYLTYNLCWENDKIQSLLLNTYIFDEPKQLQINRNFFHTNLLENTRFNNYLILDISCENATDFLNLANETEAFKAPYKWLLIQVVENAKSLSNINSDVCFEMLKNFNILPDSEVICTQNHQNEITLWQYFKVNENFTMQKEKFGVWKPESGLRVELSSNITSYRRKNLQKSNITAVLKIRTNDSLNHLYDFRFPMIDLSSKLNFAFFIAVVDYLNGTPNIRHCLNYGVEVSPGKWNGIIGLIQSKEADVTAVGIVFFRTRVKVLQFLFRTDPSRIAFIFRKPPLSYEQNIFSLPFQWTVWLSFILLVVLVAGLLTLNSYFENPRVKDSDQMNVGNILLLLSAAICQQGTDVVPTGASGRIITLIVFTAYMFLYVSYSANIVTLLQSNAENLLTHEDLLKSKIRIGAEENTWNKYYFTNSSDPTIRRMYKEKVAPNNFYNMSEGIKKMQEEFFAFHAIDSLMYHHILKTFYEHEKCECHVMPGIIKEQLGWTAAAKHSPYLEMLKIGYIKIYETGIHRRNLRRFYEKPRCSSTAPSFTSVGIIDFYPAIVIFLYGVALAVTIMLTEQFYFRYIGTLRMNCGKKNRF